MIISVENSAIIFTLKHDSANLKPLLYFINKNFQNLKTYSNMTVVFYEQSEDILRKYLLKWAYDVYQKTFLYENEILYEKMLKFCHLPIYIIPTGIKNSILQSSTVTINQVARHEICVSCSQHYNQIHHYFKLIFKESVYENTPMRSFNVLIKTKSQLESLKNILFNKSIFDINIKFKTHGLSFKNLHPQEAYSDEQLFNERLKKSYKILSVTSTSTDKEIKKNYKDMLKKYHPDKVYNQDDATVELYTKRFQVVQYAYDIIKNHRKTA